MTTEGVHAVRRDRLRALLAAEHDGRVMVITNLSNVRYLTGFSGSNAVLVVGGHPADDVIGTDGRYQDQVAEQAPDLAVLVDRDTLDAVARTLERRQVLVEPGLSIGEFNVLLDTGVRAAVGDSVVEQLRAVKDAGELNALATACAITVSAFEALAAEIRVGAVEVDLARRLEQLFGELGADDRAFDSIVAAGSHSAIPHHEPGRRALQRGDLLVVDAGARVDGYHADMTRTYLVGADPDPWQSRIHEVVRNAQAAATARYLPGSAKLEIDAAARDPITEEGFGDDYTHGLGHGVGLDIHEAPMIGPRSTGTIEANMAITVEPGVYLTGRGGVRIEDTLVVTDAGPRILTEAPRDLHVVG
jgi:Xaa-Pro aminopeptidase